MPAAVAAREQPALSLEIPAQPLREALNEFGRQSGLQVVFIQTDVDASLVAGGLAGTYSVQEALERLLANTGLRYEFLNERTVAVRAGVRDAEQISREAQKGGPLRLAQVEDGGRGDDRSEAGRAAAGVDEIVVSSRRATTATKTDAKLIETPQSISVVTADQFTDRGALLYEETLRYSASVNPEAFGTDPRLSNAQVRGFFASNYLDGLRWRFGFANLARLDVYTLERVEVLRGPSSVLYGAGSAGGLINHGSKRPQFERASEASILYGSHDRKQVQFDVTGPLGSSDALAARFVGIARDSDTQVSFVPDDRLLLMPAITWRPDEKTQLTLLGQWTRDRLGIIPQFHPLAASLLAPSGRRLPGSFFGGEPGFDRFDIDERSATLLLDHRFSDRITFSNATRYTDSRNDIDEIYLDSFTDRDPSTPAIDPYIDAAGEVVPRYAYRVDQQIEVFVTDNRLRFDLTSGPLAHKLLVGFDYQRFEQAGHMGSAMASPLNIFHPVYGSAGIPDIAKAAVPTQRLSQLGVYAQDQIDYAGRLHVVLGTRRDRSNSSVEGQPEQSDNATTLRAAAILDAWGGLSPYFSYAESFLPVAGVSAFDQEPFVPQRGTMYEAGIKWQPKPRTLLTLAAFSIRETNRFTNHPTNPNLFIQQGEVRSRGVEMEAAHQLFGSLDVTASYSYVDAQISRSNNPAEIGLQLDVTPKHQATVWGVQRFHMGADATLRAGLGARYVGEHFSSGTLRLPSYTLADALLALDRERWSLAVTASNLLDKRHYSTCLVRGDCYFGIRRNVVGTLSYRF